MATPLSSATAKKVDLATVRSGTSRRMRRRACRTARRSQVLASFPLAHSDASLSAPCGSPRSTCPTSLSAMATSASRFACASWALTFPLSVQSRRPPRSPPASRPRPRSGPQAARRRGPRGRADGGESVDSSRHPSRSTPRHATGFDPRDCLGRGDVADVGARRPKWRNGRRSGFKIRRPIGREGSSPSFGTESTRAEQLRSRTASPDRVQ